MTMGAISRIRHQRRPGRLVRLTRTANSVPRPTASTVATAANTRVFSTAFQKAGSSKSVR
jgi:hypothetical protein